MTTTAHKISLLEQFGFTIGDRDPRLNTNFAGDFMVVEATHADIADFSLPTEDGANGPWCIVGDNLDTLVDEAHSYLLGMSDMTNDISAIWRKMLDLRQDELPDRRFTSLEAPIAAPAAR